MGERQLGPVGSYITLTDKMDYRYEFAETLDRKDIRTKQGQLYTYIGQGNWRRFRLPMSWVSSSDRSLINSWWKTGTDLLFFEDSDQTSVFFDVRIVGVQEPFQSFVKPYFQTYYQGEVILETI